MAHLGVLVMHSPGITEKTQNKRGCRHITQARSYNNYTSLAIITDGHQFNP